jgi:hypothetical protein
MLIVKSVEVANLFRTDSVACLLRFFQVSDDALLRS